jgi:hypothetical protein
MTAPLDREQLLNAILSRATCDGKFRRLLLDEPKPTIHREFGIQVPANFTIKFIEKEPQVDSLVVLPDFVGGGELDEDDLENVCGGTGPGDGDPWA